MTELNAEDEALEVAEMKRTQGLQRLRGELHKQAAQCAAYPTVVSNYEQLLICYEAVCGAFLSSTSVSDTARRLASQTLVSHKESVAVAKGLV